MRQLANSLITLTSSCVARELNKALEAGEAVHEQKTVADYQTEYGSWIERWDLVGDLVIPPLVVNIQLCIRVFARLRKREGGELLFCDWVREYVPPLLVVWTNCARS